MERNLNGIFVHATNRSQELNVIDRISTFCSEESLPQRLDFLNQELFVYGYPSILSKDSLHQVNLVNVTFDILQVYRQTLESHSNTTDLLKTSEREAGRCQHQLSLAREELSTKDRELKSKCIEEAHLHQKLENLRKKFKAEQEKCRRLSADMLSRDTQYKHEKKKKTQEIERLQEKLHQVLQDKKHDRMLGIEILNPLQRSDGKRGKWSTDKTKKSNEHDMYQLILGNYEDSQKELLNENAAMRKYLKEMQNELISALNDETSQIGEKKRKQDHQLLVQADVEDDQRSIVSSISSDGSGELSDPMSEGVFELPYDVAKDDIEKSFKAKWKALRKMNRRRVGRLIKQESSTQMATGESVAKMAEYERILKEQQDLIHYFTSGQNNNEHGAPSDAYFLEEKSELEKQKALFYQQRLSFEKERKVYTEALLQLGQDRQSFEEDKAKWFQHSFLQLTPFRGKSSPDRNKLKKSLSSSWNAGVIQNNSVDKSLSPSCDGRGRADGMGTSGASPDLQPLINRSPNRTYVFTSPERTPNPWNDKSPPIPSTNELYRALGLHYYGNGKENREGTSSLACTPVHTTCYTDPSHDSMNTSETNLEQSNKQLASKYLVSTNSGDGCHDDLLNINEDSLQPESRGVGSYSDSTGDETETELFRAKTRYLLRSTHLPLNSDTFPTSHSE